MAIIGTFTTTETGFTGTIRTLTLKEIPVEIHRVTKDSDKSPDFRVYRRDVDYEFGAGWQKTDPNDQPYASVKLDDPGFAAPLYASLRESDIAGQFNLIWSR